MLFDTHAHPYMAKKKNMDDIFQNFQRSDNNYLVSIWTDLKTSKTSIDVAKSYKNTFATIWIHPTDAQKLWENFSDIMKSLESMYLENQDIVVGIWETWFDFYWISKENFDYERQVQEKFFRAHIQLAKKYNLPVIIHNRDSADEILEVLKDENYWNFIIHCFSENLEFANKCFKISKNAMMSFSWIATFKNAPEIQKTAQNIPLENILIETDAPFLTPAPYRWKQENEPAYTQYVLEKIIELRKESQEEIIQTIYNNSLEIFNLTNKKSA